MFVQESLFAETPAGAAAASGYTDVVDEEFFQFSNDPVPEPAAKFDPRHAPVPLHLRQTSTLGGAHDYRRGILEKQREQLQRRVQARRAAAASLRANKEVPGMMELLRPAGPTGSKGAWFNYHEDEKTLGRARTGSVGGAAELAAAGRERSDSLSCEDLPFEKIMCVDMSQRHKSLAAGLTAELDSPEYSEDEPPPTEPTISVKDLMKRSTRNFLTSPTPHKAGTIQCCIKRHKSGIMNRMCPKYELFTKEGDTFLMVARKRARNKTSNYTISMDQKVIDKHDSSYLGKLRGNFVGTEFIVYDDGASAKDAHNSALYYEREIAIRKELGAVFYKSNILGSRGPRKMNILLPQIDPDTGIPEVWKPETDTDGLVASYKARKENQEVQEEADDRTDQSRKSGEGSEQSSDAVVDGVVHMRNKEPKWNEAVNAYVLNFNGRVTMASVKNFQLVQVGGPMNGDGPILLQFGRVGKDTFTMDFRWPLSPLQAFGICLSSLDYKLVCE